VGGDELDPEGDTVNETVRAAIDLELALLVRTVAPPAGALGYGRDLSCVADVTPDLAEVDPFSRLGIGEAAIRRLTTPRGGLPDDPDYGFDLRAYCNRGSTVQDLRDLAGLTRSELTKDDRIEEARVSVSMPARGELTVAVRLTPADPAVEPFDLTFTVTGGGAVLEEIG
jgi:hypothetical protein